MTRKMTLAVDCSGGEGWRGSGRGSGRGARRGDRRRGDDRGREGRVIDRGRLGARVELAVMIR